MTANNDKELKEKMDTWLERLITEINKPLCQCPYCEGKGYINDLKEVKFSE